VRLLEFHSQESAKAIDLNAVRKILREVNLFALKNPLPNLTALNSIKFLVKKSPANRIKFGSKNSLAFRALVVF
jgi:hypothetical protein